MPIDSMLGNPEGSAPEETTTPELFAVRVIRKDNTIVYELGLSVRSIVEDASDSSGPLDRREIDHYTFVPLDEVRANYPAEKFNEAYGVLARPGPKPEVFFLGQPLQSKITVGLSYSQGLWHGPNEKPQLRVNYECVTRGRFVGAGTATVGEKGDKDLARLAAMHVIKEVVNTAIPGTCVVFYNGSTPPGEKTDGLFARELLRPGKNPSKTILVLDERAINASVNRGNPGPDLLSYVAEQVGAAYRSLEVLVHK